MSEAPRFSSVILSRRRHRSFPVAPIAALLLASGVHVLTASGLLLSHFLFLEVMQPARVSANIDPPIVFRPPPPAGGGDPSSGPGRFGVPKRGGGAADLTPSAERQPPPAVTQPDALAPPEAFSPQTSAERSDGSGHGPGTGFTGYDSLPEGNCRHDCGDDPGGGGPGPWGVAPDGVYREGDPRLSLPQLIQSSRILPAYPDIARRARVQGSVVLLIVVRPDGSVGAIEVVRSPDPRLGFDLTAIEAIKQWRYEPARLGVLPVAVQLTVMVEFVISR